MCNKDGNFNKSFYLPPDTYLGIVSVPDHPDYFVRLLTPFWDYYLWYDDIHLYGVYVYFPPQLRLLCLP